MTPSGLETFSYRAGEFGLEVMLGDVTGDGLGDLGLVFRSPSPQYDMLPIVGRTRQPLGAVRMKTYASWPAALGQGTTGIDTLVPLRWPGALRFATCGSPSPVGRPPVPSDYRVHFLSAAPMGLVGSVPIPTTAPPGLLPPRDLRFPVQVGDLDGDGYDEVLVWATSEAPDEDPIQLLVDGATRAVIWMDYLHPPGGNSSFARQVRLSNPHAVPCQDIDSDGVRDVVVGYLRGTSPDEWVMRCLSGVDGALLWEHSSYASGYYLPTNPRRVGDLDGDGVMDLALVHPPGIHPAITDPRDLNGYLRMVSGSSGTVLWDIPLGPVAPGFVPGQTIATLLGGSEMPVASVPDLDGDGLVDLLVFGSSTSVQGSQSVFMLSGSSGASLGSVEYSHQVAHPWWESAAGLPTSASIGDRAVGDIDGDGWPEFISYCVDTNPAVPQGWGVWGAAIYGVESLSGPGQVQEGGTVDISLWVPAGAGSAFRILVSDAFAAYDGFHLGAERDTHLGPSALLSATIGPTPIGGVLDAAGKATISKTVPVGAGLAGKRLYLAGIVLDPASSDGIRCLTNVCMIEVLP